MSDSQYLIWSNEPHAWWRPNKRGYTMDHRRAGRYPKEVAISCCRDRDQCPGEAPPELPIREADLSEILVDPPISRKLE
jgi:hypothetical protein